MFYVSGVPPADLVLIYMHEYALFWDIAAQFGIILFLLSDQLERVQKRAFGIIFPKQTYSRACEFADCPGLDVRRNDLYSNPLSKHVHLTMKRASAHGRSMRNSTHGTLYK